ncbi:MmpS family transport accessory protein [Streptomyces sp. ME02-8801-2C]|uniref:MmpS family transport accessory protein n=1 Tax=Streptomyces sp. ME02-8801-2C TaxID=3028680 RepID=UPI0029A3513D|nr:MmpS family transport accessory protein [Streptomyces sp. ME02-8801-2C]MDX3451398.1 MmpS family transport accessory protein [Streptomyces sp. ME02-8801-2C]
MGIVIGSAGGDGTEKTSAEPAPTVTKTVEANTKIAAEPAPTVTVTETTKVEVAPKKQDPPAAPEGKAVFKVWGSAPNGVDITYGSDGTNLDGSRLPMTKTLTVDEDALYYQVSAQLTGGGDVQCSVTIDGKTKTGRAKGSYNICSAQLNSDFSGGFS